MKIDTFQCTHVQMKPVTQSLTLSWFLKVIVITGLCRKLIQIQLYYVINHVDHTFNIFNISLLENLNCLSLLVFLFERIFYQLKGRLLCSEANFWTYNKNNKLLF